MWRHRPRWPSGLHSNVSLPNPLHLLPNAYAGREAFDRFDTQGGKLADLEVALALRVVGIDLSMEVNQTR